MCFKTVQKVDWNWVSCWWEEASIKACADIIHSLRYPNKTQILVQESSVSKVSVLRATKVLKCYHPQYADPSLRLNFCNWLSRNINDGIVVPQLCFMIGEPWFHLSSYINLQWVTENPQVICQIPLYNWKVDLWCAVNTRRIIFYDMLMRVVSKQYFGALLRINQIRKGTVHQHTCCQGFSACYGMLLRMSNQ